MTSDLAASSPGYQICGRCGGDGYAHLIGPLYVVCRRCGGRGEVPKKLTRIWLALRHGARHVTEGEY